MITVVLVTSDMAILSATAIPNDGIGDERFAYEVKDRSHRVQSRF